MYRNMSKTTNALKCLSSEETRFRLVFGLRREVRCLAGFGLLTRTRFLPFLFVGSSLSPDYGASLIGWRVVLSNFRNHG